MNLKKIYNNCYYIETIFNNSIEDKNLTIFIFDIASEKSYEKILTSNDLDNTNMTLEKVHLMLFHCLEEELGYTFIICPNNMYINLGYENEFVKINQNIVFEISNLSHKTNYEQEKIKIDLEWFYSFLR